MRAFVIRISDVARCPIRSLSPAHYREDGTCRCDQDETLRVITEQRRALAREVQP